MYIPVCSAEKVTRLNIGNGVPEGVGSLDK